MSFFFDWWMLVLIGIGIAAISKRHYKEDSMLKYSLSIITLLMFYVISISLFCELTGDKHGVLGAVNDFMYGSKADPGLLRIMFADYFKNHPDATSFEFMYSSGFEWLKDWDGPNTPEGIFKWIGSLVNTNVPFESFAEAVAGGHMLYIFFGVAMFSAYPFFLYAGTQLGFLMFGRKPGDKGVLGFL